MECAKIQRVVRFILVVVLAGIMFSVPGLYGQDAKPFLPQVKEVEISEAAFSGPQPIVVQMPAGLAIHQPAVVQKGQTEIKSNMLVGWEDLVFEGFEGGFPENNGWGIYYDPVAPYFWDDVQAHPFSGSRSGWCVGGAASGYPVLNPNSDNYPNNVEAWMTFGPFDLSSSTDAKLEFWYWLDSELNADYFSWLASTDFQNWGGYGSSGNSNGYQFGSLDLKAVPDKGSLIGQSQVWIGFRFKSNSSVTRKGAFVDNVSLRKFVPNQQPNLTATALSFSPNTVNPGSSINLSGAVANNGNAATGGNVKMNFFLSTDPNQPNYNLFLHSFTISGLNAGNSHNFSETGTVPSNTPPGNYYVWISIDPDNTIPESNEGDNQTRTSSQVAVVVPSPPPLLPVVTSPQIAGTEFWVDLQVGEATNPVSNLFGLSFVLNYTQTAFIDVVVPTSSNVIPGPFLGNDLVFTQNVNESAGTVSLGISRKAGQGGVSGSGVVARVKFKSLTTTPRNTNVNFSLTSVTANDPSGNPISLTPSSATTVIIPPSVPLFPVATSPQSAGTEFWIDIQAGNSSEPVSNLFGLSFVLNYTQTAFVDVVMPYSTNVIPGPFLGTDLVFSQVVDEINGTVSVGISRKSGQGGVSGSGIVLRVKFIAQTTIPNNTQVQFTLTSIAANDLSGNPIYFAPSSKTVTIVSCVLVWPGDTNNDGLVNQADVLPLGLHWGRTGPARQNASMQWIGQCAAPWSPLAATYADANGDGIVNQGDVLPIGFNWGRTHTTALASKLPTNENSSQSSVLELEASSAPAPGEEFLLRLKASNVNGLLGLAFELKCDRPDLLQIQTVEPDVLLGDDVIFYSRVESEQGKVAVGLSRKAGKEGVNGAGSVVVIKAVISAKAQIGEAITFSPQNVVANDAAGIPIEMSLRSSQIEIGATTVVDAKSETQLITEYQLYQNYPNPFNPETLVHYDLPEAGHVLLVVYNSLGQEVRRLVDEVQQPGSHQIKWDGKDELDRLLPSSIYFYRMQAGAFAAIRRMTLLR